MKPVEVRGQLVEALRLDLVGPDNGSDLEAEVLTQAPSRWYLTGFLVPRRPAKPRKATRRHRTNWTLKGATPTQETMTRSPRHPRPVGRFSLPRSE